MFTTDTGRNILNSIKANHDSGKYDLFEKAIDFYINGRIDDKDIDAIITQVSNNDKQ